MTNEMKTKDSVGKQSYQMDFGFINLGSLGMISAYEDYVLKSISVMYSNPKDILFHVTNITEHTITKMKSIGYTYLQIVNKMALRMSKYETKYTPYNWVDGNELITVHSLIEATLRHLTEISNGNTTDEGVEDDHYVAILCNMMMIRANNISSDIIKNHKEVHF